MKLPRQLTCLIEPIRSFFSPSSAHLRGASLGIGALGVGVALLYLYFRIISNFAWQKVPAYLSWLFSPLLLGLLLLGLAVLFFALIGAGIAGLQGQDFRPREQIGTLLSLGTGFLGIAISRYREPQVLCASDSVRHATPGSGCLNTHSGMSKPLRPR